MVAFRYFRMLLAPAGQSIFHQVDDVRRLTDPAFLMALAWLVAWLALAVRLRRVDGVASARDALVRRAARAVCDAGHARSRRADGRASRLPVECRACSLRSGPRSGGLGRSLARASFDTALLCKFLLAAWLTVLGGMTVLRNEVWANPVHLWLSAVQQAPDVWVPHVSLGESLQNVGSHDAAAAEYRLAISLRPERARALHEAGAVPGRDAPPGRSGAGLPEARRLSPGSRGRAGTGWVRSRCCKADTTRRGSITGRRSQARPRRRRGAAIAGDDCRNDRS